MVTNGGRTEFMDCPFDALTMSEAVEQALSWCRGERRPHTLITINAAILVMMRKDTALAEACRAGALIVPDGVPLLWASRLVGRPLRARVAGVDLMAHLLEAAAARGLKVFFLGAKEAVVTKLAGWCKSRYPGLMVAGYRNGYFKESDYAEVINQVRQSGADILFVGMPTPFKEVWCEQHREALGVPVIMGVGGSFDVLAGLIRRAPRWMQNAGLEWFWRLLMEPRKMWKRYLVTNSIFIVHILLETMRRRSVSRSHSVTF
jgi:N-acetylglucosaminyldiphosphoundecaprenol N-acetyl-beta-D-mannosaminyltransferase